LKNIIFLLFIININLLADTIYSNGKCVSNYYTLNSSTLYLEYSNGGSTSVSTSKSKLEGLVQGLNKYELVDGKCQLIASTMGMSSEQFNFLMALSGLISSFLIALSIILRF
jgi:hypothetical protein